MCKLLKNIFIAFQWKTLLISLSKQTSQTEEQVPK